MNNPEETVQLIDDPATKKAVADLKRRWPTVGAAADHPLTEFFIRRLNRKEIRRRGIDPKYWRIGIVVLIFAVVFSLRFFPVAMRYYMRFNFLFYIAIIVGVGLARKYRKPPKQHNLKSPFQLLYEAGDVSQWEHLRLAPLTYRDLAGACIGVTYHQRTTKKAWAFWAIAWIAFLVVFCASFMTRTFSQFNFKEQALQPCLALGLCFSFIVFAGLRLMRNPAYIVHMAMRRMQTIVIQRQQQFFVAHKLWRRGCSTMLLVAGVQINFMALIGLRHFAWQFISVSLIVWGIIILAISRSFAKMDLSKRFEDYIARESPEFEHLVAQMIGR